VLETINRYFDPTQGAGRKAQFARSPPATCSAVRAASATQYPGPTAGHAFSRRYHRLRCHHDRHHACERTIVAVGLVLLWRRRGAPYPSHAVHALSAHSAGWPPRSDRHLRRKTGQPCVVLITPALEGLSPWRRSSFVIAQVYTHGGFGILAHRSLARSVSSSGHASSCTKTAPSASREFPRMNRVGLFGVLALILLNLASGCFN